MENDQLGTILDLTLRTLMDTKSAQEGAEDIRRTLEQRAVEMEIDLVSNDRIELGRKFLADPTVAKTLEKFTGLVEKMGEAREETKRLAPEVRNLRRELKDLGDEKLVRSLDKLIDSGSPRGAQAALRGSAIRYRQRKKLFPRLVTDAEGNTRQETVSAAQLRKERMADLQERLDPLRHSGIAVGSTFSRVGSYFAMHDDPGAKKALHEMIYGNKRNKSFAAEATKTPAIADKAMEILKHVPDLFRAEQYFSSEEGKIMQGLEGYEQAKETFEENLKELANKVQVALAKAGGNEEDHEVVQATQNLQKELARQTKFESMDALLKQFEIRRKAIQDSLGKHSDHVDLFIQEYREYLDRFYNQSMVEDGRVYDIGDRRLNPRTKKFKQDIQQRLEKATQTRDKQAILFQNASTRAEKETAKAELDYWNRQLQIYGGILKSTTNTPQSVAKQLESGQDDIERLLNSAGRELAKVEGKSDEASKAMAAMLRQYVGKLRKALLAFTSGSQDAIAEVVREVTHLATKPVPEAKKSHGSPETIRRTGMRYIRSRTRLNSTEAAARPTGAFQDASMQQGHERLATAMAEQVRDHLVEAYQEQRKNPESRALETASLEMRGLARVFSDTMSVLSSRLDAVLKGSPEQITSSIAKGQSEAYRMVYALAEQLSRDPRYARARTETEYRIGQDLFEEVDSVLRDRLRQARQDKKQLPNEIQVQDLLDESAAQRRLREQKGMDWDSTQSRERIDTLLEATRLAEVRLQSIDPTNKGNRALLSQWQGLIQDLKQETRRWMKTDSVVGEAAQAAFEEKYGDQGGNFPQIRDNVRAVLSTMHQDRAVLAAADYSNLPAGHREEMEMSRKLEMNSLDQQIENISRMLRIAEDALYTRITRVNKEGKEEEVLGSAITDAERLSTALDVITREVKELGPLGQTFKSLKELDQELETARKSLAQSTRVLNNSRTTNPETRLRHQENIARQTAVISQGEVQKRELLARIQTPQRFLSDALQLLGVGTGLSILEEAFQGALSGGLSGESGVLDKIRRDQVRDEQKDMTPEEKRQKAKADQRFRDQSERRADQWAEDVFGRAVDEDPLKRRDFDPLRQIRDFFDTQDAGRPEDPRLAEGTPLGQLFQEMKEVLRPVERAIRDLVSTGLPDQPDPKRKATLEEELALLRSGETLSGRDASGRERIKPTGSERGKYITVEHGPGRPIGALSDEERAREIERREKELSALRADEARLAALRSAVSGPQGQLNTGSLLEAGKVLLSQLGASGALPEGPEAEMFRAQLEQLTYAIRELGGAFGGATRPEQVRASEEEQVQRIGGRHRDLIERRKFFEDLSERLGRPEEAASTLPRVQAEQQQMEARRRELMNALASINPSTYHIADSEKGPTEDEAQAIAQWRRVQEKHFGGLSQQQQEKSAAHMREELARLNTHIPYLSRVIEALGSGEGLEPLQVQAGAQAKQYARYTRTGTSLMTERAQVRSAGAELVDLMKLRQGLVEMLQQIPSSIKQGFLESKRAEIEALTGPRPKTSGEHQQTKRTLETLTLGATGSTGRSTSWTRLGGISRIARQKWMGEQVFLPMAEGAEEVMSEARRLPLATRGQLPRRVAAKLRSGVPLAAGGFGGDMPPPPPPPPSGGGFAGEEGEARGHGRATSSVEFTLDEEARARLQAQLSAWKLTLPVCPEFDPRCLEEFRAAWETLKAQLDSTLTVRITPDTGAGKGKGKKKGADAEALTLSKEGLTAMQEKLRKAINAVLRDKGEALSPVRLRLDKNGEALRTAINKVLGDEEKLSSLQLKVNLKRSSIEGALHKMVEKDGKQQVVPYRIRAEVDTKSFRRQIEQALHATVPEEGKTSKVPYSIRLQASRTRTDRAQLIQSVQALLDGHTFSIKVEGSGAALTPSEGGAATAPAGGRATKGKVQSADAILARARRDVLEGKISDPTQVADVFREILSHAPGADALGAAAGPLAEAIRAAQDPGLDDAERARKILGGIQSKQTFSEVYAAQQQDLSERLARAQEQHALAQDEASKKQHASEVSRLQAEMNLLEEVRRKFRKLYETPLENLDRDHNLSGARAAVSAQKKAERDAEKELRIQSLRGAELGLYQRGYAEKVGMFAGVYRNTGIEPEEDRYKERVQFMDRYYRRLMDYENSVLQMSNARDGTEQERAYRRLDAARSEALAAEDQMRLHLLRGRGSVMMEKIAAGVEWQRDEHGTIRTDEAGTPMVALDAAGNAKRVVDFIRDASGATVQVPMNMQQAYSLSTEMLVDRLGGAYRAVNQRRGAERSRLEAAGDLEGASRMGELHFDEMMRQTFSGRLGKEDFETAARALEMEGKIQGRNRQEVDRYLASLRGVQKVRHQIVEETQAEVAFTRQLQHYEQVRAKARQGIMGAGRAMRGISYHLGGFGVGMMAGWQIMDAFRTEVQLEQQFADIQGVLTSRSPFDREHIEAAVMGTARKYGADLLETAQAAKVLAQTGMSVDKVTTELDYTMRAMRGLGMTIEQMQELQIAVKAVRGEFKGLEREYSSTAAVLEKISRIEASYAVTSQDLANGLKVVLPVMEQYSAGAYGLADAVDYTIALTTAMVEQLRISGDQAGNALKFMFARILQPEVMKNLQDRFQFGMFQEGGMELLPLPDLIREMKKRYDALKQEGGNQRGSRAYEFLVQLGGGRRVNALVALMENFDGVLKVAEESSNSFGHTNDRVGISMDTMQSKLARLRTGFRLFVGNLTEATGFATALKAAVDRLADAFTGLSGMGGGVGTLLTLGLGGLAGARGIKGGLQYGDDLIAGLMMGGSLMPGQESAYRRGRTSRVALEVMREGGYVSRSGRVISQVTPSSAGRLAGVGMGALTLRNLFAGAGGGARVAAAAGGAGLLARSMGVLRGAFGALAKLAILLVGKWGLLIAAIVGGISLVGKVMDRMKYRRGGRYTVDPAQFDAQASGLFDAPQFLDFQESATKRAKFSSASHAYSVLSDLVSGGGGKNVRAFLEAQGASTFEELNARTQEAAKTNQKAWEGMRSGILNALLSDMEALGIQFDATMSKEEKLIEVSRMLGGAAWQANFMIAKSIEAVNDSTQRMLDDTLANFTKLDSRSWTGMQQAWADFANWMPGVPDVASLQQAIGSVVTVPARWQIASPETGPRGSYATREEAESAARAATRVDRGRGGPNAGRAAARFHVVEQTDTESTFARLSGHLSQVLPFELFQSLGQTQGELPSALDQLRKVIESPREMGVKSSLLDARGQFLSTTPEVEVLRQWVRAIEANTTQQYKVTHTLTRTVKDAQGRPKQETYTEEKSVGQLEYMQYQARDAMLLAVGRDDLLARIRTQGSGPAVGDRQAEQEFLEFLRTKLLQPGATLARQEFETLAQSTNQAGQDFHAALNLVSGDTRGFLSALRDTSGALNAFKDHLLGVLLNFYRETEQNTAETRFAQKFGEKASGYDEAQLGAAKKLWVELDTSMSTLRAQRVQAEQQLVDLARQAAAQGIALDASRVGIGTTVDEEGNATVNTIAQRNREAQNEAKRLRDQIRALNTAEAAFSLRQLTLGGVLGNQQALDWAFKQGGEEGAPVSASEGVLALFRQYAKQYGGKETTPQEIESLLTKHDVDGGEVVHVAQGLAEAMVRFHQQQIRARQEQLQTAQLGVAEAEKRADLMGMQLSMERDLGKQLLGRERAQLAIFEARRKELDLQRLLEEISQSDYELALKRLVAEQQLSMEYESRRAQIEAEQALLESTRTNLEGTFSGFKDVLGNLGIVEELRKGEAEAQDILGSLFKPMGEHLHKNLVDNFFADLYESLADRPALQALFGGDKETRNLAKAKEVVDGLPSRMAEALGGVKPLLVNSFSEAARSGAELSADLLKNGMIAGAWESVRIWREAGLFPPPKPGSDPKPGDGPKPGTGATPARTAEGLGTVHPLGEDAPITSRFGDTRGRKNPHTGLDLDGKMGDPIRSMRAGRVVKVMNEDRGGHGKYVIVEQDDGYRALYGHMQGADVQEGEEVLAGRVLGRMGNTGNVIPGPGGDGSHLHLEMWNAAKTRIDPTSYLFPRLRGDRGGPEAATSLEALLQAGGDPPRKIYRSRSELTPDTAPEGTPLWKVFQKVSGGSEEQARRAVKRDIERGYWDGLLTGEVGQYTYDLPRTPFVTDTLGALAKMKVQARPQSAQGPWVLGETRMDRDADGRNLVRLFYQTLDRYTGNPEKLRAQVAWHGMPAHLEESLTPTDLVDFVAAHETGHAYAAQNPLKFIGAMRLLKPSRSYQTYLKRRQEDPSLASEETYPASSPDEYFATLFANSLMLLRRTRNAPGSELKEYYQLLDALPGSEEMVAQLLRSTPYQDHPLAGILKQENAARSFAGLGALFHDAPLSLDPLVVQGRQKRRGPLRGVAEWMRGILGASQGQLAAQGDRGGPDTSLSLEELLAADPGDPEVPEAIRKKYMHLGAGKLYYKNGNLVYDSPNRTRDGKVPTHRVSLLPEDVLAGKRTVEQWESDVLQGPLTESLSRSALLPERSFNSLAEDVQPQMRALMERMRAEGHQIQINETLRTQERQNFLFRRGRSLPGSPVTWTLTSSHRDGRAVDFLVNGDASGRNAGYRDLWRIAQEMGLEFIGPSDAGHISAPTPAPRETLALPTTRLTDRLAGRGTEMGRDVSRLRAGPFAHAGGQDRRPPASPTLLGVSTWPRTEMPGRELLGMPRTLLPRFSLPELPPVGMPERDLLGGGGAGRGGAWVTFTLPEGSTPVPSAPPEAPKRKARVSFGELTVESMLPVAQGAARTRASGDGARYPLPGAQGPTAQQPFKAVREWEQSLFARVGEGIQASGFSFSPEPTRPSGRARYPLPGSRGPTSQQPFKAVREWEQSLLDRLRGGSAQAKRAPTRLAPMYAVPSERVRGLPGGDLQRERDQTLFGPVPGSPKPRPRAPGAPRLSEITPHLVGVQPTESQELLLDAITPGNGVEWVTPPPLTTQKNGLVKGIMSGLDKKLNEYELAKASLTRSQSLALGVAQMAGNFAGTAVGANVGGSSRGAATGSTLGGSIGTVLGAPGGPVGMALGSMAGSLLGGIAGGFLGKKDPNEDGTIPQLSAIEKNTRESVRLLEVNNSLLNPDHALLNLPSSFNVPGYMPQFASGGGGGDAGASGGGGASRGETTNNNITLNVNVNGGDPQDVEQAVERAISRALGTGRRHTARRIDRY